MPPMSAIRAAITRSLWYALRRNAIELAPARAEGFRLNRMGAARSATSTTREPSSPSCAASYLLNALSDEELALLASAIKPYQFGKGEVLMHRGGRGRPLLHSAQGTRRVYAHGQTGAPQKHVGDIVDSSPENFFGEIALLTGGKRNATIRATTDVDVWEIGRDAFAKLFTRQARRRSLDRGSGGTPLDRNQPGNRRDAGASDTVAIPRRLRRSAMILLAMRKMFDF